MAIHYVYDITVTRQPAECTPGRTPGWYVQDRGKIVAYCDTEEEAGVVAAAFARLPERVGTTPTMRQLPHSERAIYEAQNREDARAKTEGRTPRLIATMDDIRRIEEQ